MTGMGAEATTIVRAEAISSAIAGQWRPLRMSVLGTYQGASTIMRKALDWNLYTDRLMGGICEVCSLDGLSYMRTNLHKGWFSHSKVEDSQAHIQHGDRINLL
jgi:hypothetical protein